MASKITIFPKNTESEIKKPIITKKQPELSILGSGKTIEETYRQMDPREHVLLRPSTYIGSIQPNTENRWVMNEVTNRMERRDITTVEGFYKIFDEIAVNAIDQWTRLDEMKIKNPNIHPVTKIKVILDESQGLISVENDGDGIDVVMHEEQKMYVPEMIFANLLTGANYDDSEEKIVGGQNGLGAKLCNIFSKEFVVETVDPSRHLKYTQKFSNNMSVTDCPIIETYNRVPYTKITYKPDFAKLNIKDPLKADDWLLLKHRVYDIAACTGKNVSIYLNDVKIKTREFEDYANLYIGNKRETKRVYINPHPRWEIIVCLSPHFPPRQEQISFVNGISTDRGGKHVSHVVDGIARKLSKFMVDHKKVKKGAPPIKDAFIKNHIWVFVKAQIVNPLFDTQTKRCMTSLVNQFGSKCEIDDDAIEQISKIGIIDKAQELANMDATMKLGKMMAGKKTAEVKMKKLEDAKDAGGARSHLCYLILTEGDSAAAFVESAVKAIKNEDARNKIGYFPLRGKLLNTRTATHVQLENNKEILAIMKIVGLVQGMDYTNSISSLRYGRLMILTDADTDGDHIKGLIINFISQYWPSLVKRGFICSIPTPIIKAWKETPESNATGIPDEKTQKNFYSDSEYKSWKESDDYSGKWQIKYYKGLGTHTPVETIRIFANMQSTIYTWDDSITKWKNLDVDLTSHTINLVFSKKYENERKKWIVDYINGDKAEKSYLIDTESLVTFFNHRMIRFSVADCERSIPSVIDGLKPSQRKIVFSCFKRKLVKELKVAQLAGYVAEHSAYHHGEVAVSETITKMGANFVGSKNLNIIQGIGQFGTRTMKGKNASQPRYITCKLSQLAYTVFNPLDNNTLKYLTEDDGTKTISIEPVWYIPILPMLLVNGSVGIGTGSSTYIPSFNPIDIIDNIKRHINGTSMQEMVPWFRGFQGTVEKITESKYIVIGRWTRLGENKIRITELPVGPKNCKSFSDYTLFLDKSMEDEDEGKGKKSTKGKSKVDGDDGSEESLKPLTGGILLHRAVTANDTDYKADLTFRDGYLTDMLADNKNYAFEKSMHLACDIPLTNLVAYNADGILQKYESPIEIMQHFCEVRLKYYIKRKQWLLDDLTHKYLMISAKFRFVTEIIDAKINIYRKRKTEIISILDGSATKDAANPSYPIYKKKADSTDPPNYEYLLSMRIDSFSEEMLQKLKKDKDEIELQLTELKATTENQLWCKDLDELANAYLDDLEMWYRITNVIKMPVRKVIPFKITEAPKKTKINICKVPTPATILEHQK